MAGNNSVPAARVRGLTVKFDRQAIIDGIEATSDATVLSIYGKVNRNGGLADFEGSGTIRTIDPGKGKHHGDSHRSHGRGLKIGLNSHDQNNPGKDEHSSGKGKK